MCRNFKILVAFFIVLLNVCLTISLKPSSEEQDNQNGNKKFISGSITTLKNRQSAGQLSISGPVAAGLAFVGLNLAFISLLVPFVITAISVDRRRQMDIESPLESRWDRIKSLLGLDSQEVEHFARSISNRNKGNPANSPKFGQSNMSKSKTNTKN